MTDEDFCDFFKVRVGGLFHEMRCSQSCYFCDLELVDLFDAVDQVVFSENDFLIDQTADFRFYVAGCPVSFSPANESTDIYFDLCQCVTFFCFGNDAIVLLLFSRSLIICFLLPCYFG